MAITDMIANGVASLTGSIAKAKIKIKDNRSDWEEAQITVQEGIAAGSNATDILGSVGAIVSGGAQGSGGKLGSFANKVSSGLDSMTGGKLGLNSASTLANAMADGYNKVFEVQFNPSTLALSGRGGGSRNKYSLTEAKSLKDSASMTRIELSVKLIFSKDDLAAAFPADTMAINATNALNVGKKLVKEKVFGVTQPAVQVVVEGFIGALRNENTRLVAFEWGDMFYEGLLKNVNATYNLFDATGKPVRAEVNLSLWLRDPEVTMASGTPNLGYWQDAYDQAFSSSTSYISTAQKIMRTITGDKLGS